MLHAIAPFSSQIFFTSITTLNLHCYCIRCNILGITLNLNPFTLHLLLSLKTIHLVPVWIWMKATFCVLRFFFFFARFCFRGQKHCSRTVKHCSWVKKILKLFTHLKIIMLQYFQFSGFSFSKNKLYSNRPLKLKTT